MAAWLAWVRRVFDGFGRIRIPDTLWQRALRRAAWTHTLDAAAKWKLRDFSERFLADKAISPAGGLALDDEGKVLIAMLCCRPVLAPGYQWLQGWSEVIVYPGQFRIPQSDVDGDVVHESHAVASGQAWSRGPVILSWDDIRASLDSPRPGYDVVAHEIAHKIDVLDGSMDGAPALVARERQAWARDFQAAYDRLRADLDAGREPTIDPYAAQAPEEFFAVCSEYWFTAPELLRAKMPAVAERLLAFYGKP